MTSSDKKPLVRADNCTIPFDPKRETLIVLEGSDKVGKSTLYQKLRRATNYQPLVIDRFIGSNMVYDQFYDRPELTNNIQRYLADEKTLNSVFNLVIVLVTVSESEAISRIEKLEAGVDKDIALANFNGTTKLFKDYLDSSPARYKYILNTTETSVEECIEILLSDLTERGFTKGHEEAGGHNPILATVRKLQDQISLDGCKHENTLELLAPRLELQIKGPEANIKSLEAMEEDIKAYYGERYERRMEAERFHYKQLGYGLLHKIEELHFFHKSPVESRKAIIFSNDCISSIQYLKRDNVTYLVVHMRSSDAKDLLPLDLLYLAKMLRRVNEVYLREPARVPFNKPAEYEYLIVTIGSAHMYLSGGRE